MAKKHDYCNKENYSKCPEENSDESIIEGSPCPTPVRKKPKIRNRAKAKFWNKIYTSPLETVQNNETNLLNKLIKEMNCNKTLNRCKHEETTFGEKSEDESMVLKKDKLENLQINKESLKFYAAGPSISGNTIHNDPQNKSAFELLTKNLDIKLNISGYLDDQEQEVTRPTCRGITEHIEKPISKNYHNLYLFYLIKEVLKFTPNNFPKNSCLQLVGQFQHKQKESHFLCSYEKNYGHCYQIKVDLREAPMRPSDGERIILFGVICFENNIPIVVAKFFQQTSIDYRTYTDLMLHLRTTVPGENFNMVCDTDLTYNETLVESRDDEQFFNDLTLKLSGEHVENNELSDSKLGAFLDEISFENL